MSDHTKIEWADATVNFWWGCSKVSPACAHCYAEREMTRYGRDFTNVYGRPRVEKGQTVDVNAIRAMDSWTFPLGARGGAWDTDSRVCLKGSAPYPATLLSLVIDIETNEDPAK